MRNNYPRCRNCNHSIFWDALASKWKHRHGTYASNGINCNPEGLYLCACRKPELKREIKELNKKDEC